MNRSQERQRRRQENSFCPPRSAPSLPSFLRRPLYVSLKPGIATWIMKGFSFFFLWYSQYILLMLNSSSQSTRDDEGVGCGGRLMR
jgi:hypothetical protein